MDGWPGGVFCVRLAHHDERVPDQDVGVTGRAVGDDRKESSLIPCVLIDMTARGSRRHLRTGPSAITSSGRVLLSKV
jgi:hypothetical protein